MCSASARPTSGGSPATGVARIPGRALGLEILRLHPEAVASLPPEVFRARAAELDEWGLCDLLGTAILGPWVLADLAARMEILYELVEGEGVWRPRLALVATVPITRSGTVPADFALSLLDRVLGRREPMIVKAASWSLREIAKRDRRRELNGACLFRVRGISMAHSTSAKERDRHASTNAPRSRARRAPPVVPR